MAKTMKVELSPNNCPYCKSENTLREYVPYIYSDDPKPFWGEWCLDCGNSWSAFPDTGKIDWANKGRTDPFEDWELVEIMK